MNDCQLKSCESYDKENGGCIASVNPSECDINLIARLREVRERIIWRAIGLRQNGREKEFRENMDCVECIDNHFPEFFSCNGCWCQGKLVDPNPCCECLRHRGDRSTRIKDNYESMTGGKS